jgi:hypothetical protein
MIALGRRVKFGAFMEHLNSTYPGRFDRIATGHYAAVSHNEGGVAQLSCTRDAVKDQTYFLAHLSQVTFTYSQLSVICLSAGMLCATHSTVCETLRYHVLNSPCPLVADLEICLRANPAANKVDRFFCASLCGPVSSDTLSAAIIRRYHKLTRILML